MVLYIKRCLSLKLDLNLPDQSQFYKIPTACPPHLQPTRYTDSLPTTPTACPPHLQPTRPTYSLPTTPTAYPPHVQPARPTYSLPTTPTACPLHLQLARHTFKLNYTMSHGGTTAFSDSARLEFERYLRSPDQNNRKRLTNPRIALIKVY